MGIPYWRKYLRAVTACCHYTPGSPKVANLREQAELNILQPTLAQKQAVLHKERILSAGTQRGAQAVSPKFL